MRNQLITTATLKTRSTATTTTRTTATTTTRTTVTTKMMMMLAFKLAFVLVIALALTITFAPFSVTANAVTANAVTANPTASTVLVNGQSVDFDAYKINDNNYFKLRDLAYTLIGTEKQFDVGWDGAADAISLTSGQPYTVVGGEMTSKGDGTKDAAPTSSRIVLDGNDVAFTAYHIEGNNYFKLRDIGEAFDFGVDWEGSRNTIAIDTGKGYTLDNEAMMLYKQELAGLWSRIDGSTATIPLTAAMYGAIDGDGLPPEHNTTPNAYSRLIYGTETDLIFVTYPSVDEMQMAKEEGVELEIIPVVKDALVFLVNAENPVDDIPLSKLRDVYTGMITNWNGLEGADESIIPYQRTQNSGSQTLFQKLVMEETEPMKPPTEWVAEAMGALVEAVSDYDNSKNAIGYSMFYYVNNMYGNSRFKLLAIDGVAPSRDTIVQGEYALEDYYYAVLRKDTPSNSPARTLVNWLLTDAGQTIAAKAGYIPLRPLEGVSPEYSIDPIYQGDTDISSGTGGTVLKAGTEDAQPVNGVRPPLSDFFYEGFNYIRYINTEIMSQLDRVDYERWFQITEGELFLIRPFPGIPGNYPNYEFMENSASRFLIISFPTNNPYFVGTKDFYIELTEDISPYGTGRAAYSVTYDYARDILPQVGLYTLRVDLPNNPDSAERINEQLKEWTDTFPGTGDSKALLDSFIKWYMREQETSIIYRLQPTIGLWRNYLSVNYYLQTYDGPYTMMPLLSAISFDIDTGSVVDLVDALPKELDYSKSSGFTLIDFEDIGEYGFPRQEQVSEPAEGATITDAWIVYDSPAICIEEPSGRILQFNFWDVP